MHRNHDICAGQVDAEQTYYTEMIRNVNERRVYDNIGTE